MKLDIKIDQRQIRNFDQLTKLGIQRLNTKLNYIVDSTARDIVADTQTDMLIGSKTGNLYKKITSNGVTKYNHESSAIGETPAVISGGLSRDFKVSRHGTGSSHMATITNTSEYAPILSRMGRVIVLNDEAAKRNMKDRVRQTIKDIKAMYKRKR